MTWFGVVNTVWTGPNSSKYGHTKGVLGVADDAATGFWFVHSVPKFAANFNGTYEGYAIAGVVLWPLTSVCCARRPRLAVDSYAPVASSCQRERRMTACGVAAWHNHCALVYIVCRYPSTGVTYGQSMLCISLDGPSLESLAKPLRLYRPQVRLKLFR